MSNETIRKSKFIWTTGLFVTQLGLILTYSNCSQFNASNGRDFSSFFADQAQSINNPNLKFQCTDAASRGKTEANLQRLTTPELVNTLSDLLGAATLLDPDIKGQIGQLSSDRIITSLSEFKTDAALGQSGALLAIAAKAAALIIDVPSERARVLGSCAASDQLTDSCVGTVIANFGLRALRRPLTSDETASYFASYADSGKGVLGLKRIFMRFLMNPSMTFHLENGIADLADRARLTDYEIASRISYRTVGTMPDAALFDAAAKGELQKLSQVEVQVRRLYASHPLAKSKIDDFFRVYLQIDRDHLSDASSDEAAADKIDLTGLKDEMIQETRDYYNYIIWTKKGKFSDLFTSTAVFPRTARMAKILGTQIAVGDVPSQVTPEHAGLLLRPSFLSSSSIRSAAMHRGVAIRRRILCEGLGDPPAAAVTARQNSLGDLSLLANRDQLTQLTNAPLCMSCHARINSLGFALEGFDQLGMVRTSENIFKNGVLVKQMPVDTAVTDLGLEAGAPQSASGGVALTKIILGTTAASACFAQSVFEESRLRAAGTDDSCLLQQLENDALDTGSILSVFVHNVANEDIFWKSRGN